ncbi:MAG: FAD-dependent oxidoreductase, partial [Christensenellaceae bacterium]|nr:FAD-dependent oxidoreductase [Christensenellaceae bacterium]
AELCGAGVSYCATCDGAFFRDLDVCVIGGGDTALEDAMYLSGVAKSVTVIHRRQELRAQSVLQQRARQTANIRWKLGYVPTRLEGKFELTGVALKKADGTGEEEVLPMDGCFVAVGRVPDTALVAGKIEMNEWGYIPVGESTVSSIPGVFVAGDLRVKGLRQVVTAAADGAVAATAAWEYIVKNG